MVLTKPAMVFLWLGGSILDHKNEPIYPSWKQDSFQNAFANLLALSSLAQFSPSSWNQVQNGQQHLLGLVVWVWAGRMENAHLHL